MALIELNDIDLSFGDKIIFNKANFVIQKNDKMGIVGVNGAGKSTLLKLLIKELLYDSGSMYINPKIKIGYLDQQALINSDKSIFDYLKDSFAVLYEEEKQLISAYEKMALVKSDAELVSLSNLTDRLMKDLQVNDFYNLEITIKKVADGLGISAFGLDNKVKLLSGGQREKVKLARLLLENPDVLLLDEPTNFLDTTHIDWLSSYLTKFDGTFVAISHDEDFLKRVTNCICDVDLLKITRYNVGYSKFLEMKQLATNQQQLDYERQQKKIDTMEKLIDRFRYKATKASMVQSRIKTLNKMEKIEPPSTHAKPSFTFAYKKLGSKVLLEATNLVIGYDKPLLKRAINITLEKGEKLAITGFNGIGKSTFLKTISGIIPSLNGTYKLATNTIIGYYEQDLNFDDDTITPLTYISNFYPKLTEKEIRSSLSKCGLKTEHILKPIKNLSGGEQSKTKICKLTLSPVNILILDEPTNHIDKNAITQLSNAIKVFEGTVLFVSHDNDFVKANADKVLSLESLLV